MPPRDGEGTPPGNDDELLAKVIPLRRRGTEPVEPQILADEPRHTPGPPEDPPELTEWSIWEPLPAKLNWRERKPPSLRVLADEPGGLSDSHDPLASGEWSIWDRSPPPLRRRKAPDTGRASGAGAVGHHIARRGLIRTAAVAAATICGAALALGFVTPDGAPAPTSQRTTSGLQASRPNATPLPKSTASRSRRSTAARARSHHRRPPGRTSKTTSTVPGRAAVFTASDVSATVQYRPPTSPSHTTTSTSSPPTKSTRAPTEGSAAASASREFSFER